MSSSAESGRFRLTLRLPRATWAADTPIAGSAALSLLAGATASLSGSGSGVIAFAFREVGGLKRDVEPVLTADCAQGAYRVGSGAPLARPIWASGGVDPADPQASFYASFLTAPDVRLPAGDWTIVAVASFDDGPTCTAHLVEIQAALATHVTG